MRFLIGFSSEILHKRDIYDYCLDIDLSLKRRPKSIDKATLGSNIKFSCAARSFPKALYVWYKDGYKLNQTTRIIITSTGDLVMIDLRSGDAGQYHCVASNYFGSVNSSSAKLQIDKCNRLVKSNLDQS